jgi:chorismate synthase
MGFNTFGTRFCVSSFGESHGPAVGVLVDGMPAGIEFDEALLVRDLSRRRPGQSSLSTTRNEDDAPEVLSGVFEGKTTGAPICILIRNKDARSSDYEALKDVYRPSHADFTYHEKYGVRDYRGGGRSSARVTAGWVAAGALAKMLLNNRISAEITAWVSSIYNIHWEGNPEQVNRDLVEASAVRCPDAETAARMSNAIEEAKAAGDSLGGVITCVMHGIPTGIGEPLFGKLQAKLAEAMLSINAVKGFEYGSGFAGSTMKGSEHNDAYELKDGRMSTKTNHSGGIQGGISNGAPIVFRVAFKPVASIARQQETLNRQGEQVPLEISGRHDPCVVPRAVPIVEAMAAVVLADLWLAKYSL